jgi:hypothetical protein
MTTEQKLRDALSLLERVVAAEIQAPDPQWFRDYFLLTGQHMILTEEGWESGDSKQAYLDGLNPEDSIEDVILDEVGALEIRDAR